MNKQKGFSSVLVVVAFAAVIGVFVLYLMDASDKTDLSLFGNEEDSTMMENDKTGMMENDLELQEIEEDETTPEEINNDSLDELDSIILEINNDTTLESEFDL